MFNGSTSNLNLTHDEKQVENDWSYDNDTHIGTGNFDTLTDIFGGLKIPFPDINANQTFDMSDDNPISSLSWHPPSSSSSSDDKSVSLIYFII